MSDSNTPTGFDPPAISHLAELLPGYRIIRLIACGGMGAVYEAVQVSLDRPVAIKILPREYTVDESFRNAFESEAKTMARLNHPNLIGVYDFGEIEGMLFIAMEYVPGLSLFEAAAGQPILQAEIIPLISAVARGLAYAHENGVIHRDIKPANILLNHSNQPKIGDFGLARPRERQIQEGETIFGTPGYTAPEVTHKPQSIDHRADIFSLGVLLHELLTGKLPEADPRNPSAICRCDFRFDTIIRKATHPDPAQRYDNAADIATELEKITVASGPRTLRTAASQPRKTALPAAGYRPQTRHVPASSGSNTPVIVILSGVIVIILILLIIKASRTSAPLVAPDPEPVTLPKSTIPAIPPPRPPPSTPTPTPPPPTPQPEPEPPPAEPNPDVQSWGGASSFWSDDADSIQFSVRSGRISGHEDGGVFKHQPWTGDGVFTVHIQSLIGGVATSAAGLMVREELDAGSRNLFLACDRTGQTFAQHRSERDGDTVEFQRSELSFRYLRIRREDGRLEASASPDGIEWSDFGAVELGGLATDIHVGFAAASDTDNGDPLFTGSYDSFRMSDDEDAEAPAFPDDGKAP